MITPSRPIEAKDVAGHYNELDRFYRELWGEHVHHGYWLTGKERPAEAVEQLVDHVASQLDLAEDQRVLDIGCGYGATSRQLARDYHVNITGLTVSEAQHRYASACAAEHPRVEILLRNWLDNHLDPESIDRVVSIECISHIVDKPKYFREVARVLKPGGRAVIIAWLTGEQPTPYQIRYFLEPICREGRLPSMASESEYAEMIANAGLWLARFADLTKEVRSTWSICARRVAWGLIVRPSYWWFLISRASQHAVFLLSVYRILWAYRNGAMRYGLFVIEKPATE